MSSAAARPAGAAPSDSLDIRVDVETPEQIAFSYTVAGVGSRAAAAAIDTLVCVGGWLAVLVALAILVGGGLSVTRSAEWLVSSASWVFAILALIQFAIVWGYYVLFEGLRDGQTPGKRVMKLRVVRDGGYSVTFGTSAVRNLVRAVDMQPGFLYLVGIFSALVTRSGKRLGDVVAGTMVIKEGTTLRYDAPRQRSDAPPPALVTLATLATLLDDDEYALLERYVARRQELAPERRQALAGQLATRFAERLPARPNETPSALLLRLFEHERAARASGVAARSDTGARREQHALVATGLARWNAFAEALGRARKTGVRRMTPRDVSELVAQYRELTTDLARLQTATRGRDSDAVFYVSRLVAGGHNLLYRQRGATVAGALRYVTRTVPREIRRSWIPIAIAAALLFGPTVASYVAVARHPAVAGELLPEEMLQRASSGAERARRGEGYVTIDERVRPIVASQIMTNNVKIAYLAFALGVTAGVGTVLLLVFNGVSIGSGMGVFAANGVARLLLAFIAPHGVLELAAICVAGGGGLLVASGIVLPGAATRRRALVERGRRAVDLIAGATVLLIVAGTIEGLVSPRVWPLEWKLAVSAATAVALVAYLSSGRGADRVTTAPGL